MVSIDPNSVNFANGSGSPGPYLGPGTYRFTFTYGLASDEGDEPLVAFSESFTIG